MRRFPITPRLVLGLAILTFGLVLMLDNLDVWDASESLRIWASAWLLTLGAYAWRHSHLAGVGLIFLGLWSALSEVFDRVPWSADLFWPLILVLFGANMVVGALSRKKTPGRFESDTTFQTVAIWSGVGRKVSSSTFKSGEAFAVMGGCTIDLRSSFIADGEAEIFVFTMWGAVEILVPEDWSVTNKGIPIMAGFDDCTVPPRGGSQQRLLVHGLALMAGAEIRNRPEKENED